MVSNGKETFAPSMSTWRLQRPPMARRPEPRQRLGASYTRDTGCTPIAMSTMRRTAVGRADGVTGRPSTSATDTMIATAPIRAD